MIKKITIAFVLIQLLLAIPLLVWPGFMLGNVMSILAAVGGYTFLRIPVLLQISLTSLYPLVFLLPLVVSALKRQCIIKWQIVPAVWLVLVVIMEKLF